MDSSNQKSTCVISSDCTLHRDFRLGNSGYLTTPFFFLPIFPPPISVVSIVPVCCSALFSSLAYFRLGVETEGLFRLNGNLELVKSIKDRLDAGEDVDFMEISDAHTVAHLLKLWFRELPEVLSPNVDLPSEYSPPVATPDLRTLRLLPRRSLCVLSLRSCVRAPLCVYVCVCVCFVFMFVSAI